jgi:transcriptional regulator
MTTFTTEDRLNAEASLADMDTDTIDVEMTQSDIAIVMGVCRQTVINTEKRAFKKIRKAFFKAGINKEDFL